MSSGCGDVLSLADLQTAKKHQIFEAEVITGKSGGVATGANIDYATNQVTGQTQKTLPAVLRDAGFSPVSWDFSTGGTLTVNDRDKVVYDPVSKTWYSYAGTLPVVVPASFNPVGNANWKPQTDPNLRDDLLSQLSSTDAPSGGSLIGYKNPKSLTAETVTAALDKINIRVIYAEDFGVKTDTSDNADALWELGQFISASQVPLHVVFPSGVSLVGSQQLAGASGLGYSWRPSYLSRSWSNLSAAGWFSIANTNQKIVLDMSGWTLKLNDGMRIGAFDPITGAVSADKIAENPDSNFLASSGYLIKLYLAPNVEIVGGATDGNLANVTWGGKYGNTGYQVPAYNMWVNQSEGAVIERHTFKNSPVDGLYMQAVGERSYLDIVPKTYVIDCEFRDCGRNCYSLTGGANIAIESPIISNSGRNASGIGPHYSGPETGLDIEAEGGNPYNISIINPKIINTGKAAIMTVSTPGVVNDIRVEGGVLHSFHSEGAIVNAGPSRNLKFKNVTIIGGVIDSGTPSAMGREAYEFDECRFINQYGSSYVDGYLLSFPVSSFTNNIITFGVPPTGVASATLNISDQDAVVFGVIERFRNNTLIVYGDATKITFANGLGGINNFKNADLYVNAGGITAGSTKLITDTCSVGLSGIRTNSSLFTVESGVTMAKDYSRNLWFAQKPCKISGVLSPASLSVTGTGSQDLGGASSGRFKTGYFDSGIIVRDGVTGTHYRIRVTSGSLNIVTDEA